MSRSTNTPATKETTRWLARWQAPDWQRKKLVRQLPRNSKTLSKEKGMIVMIIPFFCTDFLH
jgi:hypothetical protein